MKKFIPMMMGIFYAITFGMILPTLISSQLPTMLILMLVAGWIQITCMVTFFVWRKFYA